ncbi:MAG: response regulator [Campylobacterales bacterium]|nr:response regulator [Campylobacterales bacterium]
MKSNNNFNILIVDDEKFNIELAAAYLSEDGYNLSFATNAVSAIAGVYRHKIDLILLDINMPEKDGFEVCEILKSDSRTKDIPIIFLTAQTDINYISRAFEVGGIDYINKPFNGIELKIRVKTHLQSVAYLEEIKNKQSKLAQLSITDPLTKLHNSFFFDSQIKNYQHSGGNFWVIYLKINNFEKINQLYGFYGANKIIRLFAKILNEATQSNAIVAKLYGVSFGILLKNYDKSSIKAVGRNISSEFSKNIALHKTIQYSIVYLNVTPELTIPTLYKKLQTHLELIEQDSYMNNSFIQ